MSEHRLLHTLWFICAFIVIATYAHGDHEHLNKNTGPNPKSFNDPSITNDEAHLKEHLKDEINTKDKMTPEQMEFHYFRLHDTNNDTHLDGTEILQAMAHMMPAPELQLHEKLGKSKEQIEMMINERQHGMNQYYEDLIDRVLVDDDVDKDGYLTYSEFVRARRRDEYHQRQMQENEMRHMQQVQFEQFQQFQAQQQGGPPQQGQFRPTIPPPPPAGGQQPQGLQHGQEQQFEQFQKFQQQQGQMQGQHQQFEQFKQFQQQQQQQGQPNVKTQ